MSVLAELLVRAEQHRDRQPVFIFDLDSTLFSTQERNHAILREFIERIGAPVDFQAIARRLTTAELGWNIVDDLRERGFRHDGTLDRLKTFWHRRFFTDDYLAHDQPVPGAAAYVGAAQKAGATIYYLTGRDEPGMGKGTRLSLRVHGFPPEGERVLLRLKPTFEESDIVFKRRVLGELGHLGPVLAAFENEPANANLFAEQFPEATVVFLETIHSPDPPPLAAGIFRAKNFLDV